MPAASIVETPAAIARPDAVRAADIN